MVLIARCQPRRRSDADSGGGRDDRAEVAPGWDENRVREVLAQYESQTEDEQFAEIEAAWEAEGMTLMAIPAELVGAVRALLAHKQSA